MASGGQRTSLSDPERSVRADVAYAAMQRALRHRRFLRSITGDQNRENRQLGQFGWMLGMPVFCVSPQNTILSPSAGRFRGTKDSGRRNSVSAAVDPPGSERLLLPRAVFDRIYC